MSASKIQAGAKVPDATLAYTEPAEDNVCGVPGKLKIHEAWKGKKVVIFSVPGAFTPTCHVNHLPPYLEKFDEFKAKGVDVLAVVAANDEFVMGGWAKASGIEGKILALSDAGAKWSKELGMSIDLNGIGWGDRTARYALIIDDLVVKYAEQEPGKGVTVSGADAVLSKL